MNMESLKKNKDFFTLLVNTLDNMIFLIDKNRNIVEYNTGLLENFKVDKDRLKLKCGNALGCAKAKDENIECGEGFFCKECVLNSSFAEVITEGKSIKQFPMAKEFYLGDEKVEKHFLLSAKHTNFNDEDVAIVVLDDVTPLAEAKIKLEEMIIKDFLTGIYNRRFLYEELNRLVSTAKRYQAGFSLLIADLDYFKRVNDTLGHQVGDEVIKKTAAILKDTLRECDIVGRYGGEEFMVILPHLDEEEAYLCAERLRMEVEKADFNISLPVTISISCAQYSKGMEVEDLIHKADTLLYKAKDDGRNKSKV